MWSKSFAYSSSVSKRKQVTYDTQSAHKHEVDNRLQICGVTEVLMVSSRKAGPDTMVVVHHARDTVKAEAVKLVLLHPEAEVAEQESKDLMMAVVEQTAVPQFMPTASAFMEVEVVRAIEVVEPVENVLAGVRVDDVKENGNSHPVSSVDQLLELLRRAIS